MANPSSSTQSNLGSSKLGDLLQDNTHTLQQVTREMTEKARDSFDTVSDQATELYNEAGSWIGENYMKLIGGAAIVVGVGLIGYYLIQNFRGSSSSEMKTSSNGRKGSGRQKGSGQLQTA